MRFCNKNLHAYSTRRASTRRSMCRLRGGRRISSSSSGSLTSATAGSCSVIRSTMSTHSELSICGTSNTKRQNTGTSSGTACDNVYAISFRRLLKASRPSRMDSTMEQKSSSRQIMSAASLATSLPAADPIATPTSAARSAGASLVPSPVTATTAPAAWYAATMRCFCRGEVRANTTSSCNRSASDSAPSDISFSAKPVRIRAPTGAPSSSPAPPSRSVGRVRRPVCRAMASAVSG